MVTKLAKPFKTLAVTYDGWRKKTAIFSVNDKIGAWIEPFSDIITWSELSVYGVPDMQDALDKVYDNDFSLSTKIGTIFGYHIPKSLLIDLGEDPYEVCDSMCADLEAMYSVLLEYELADDFCDNIYYIHEIEISPEYQGFGYEKKLLLQLPAIIVDSLNVQPSLLMYFPAPTQYDEPEHDDDIMAALLHRLEYNTQMQKRDDNITLFPPIYEIPEKEINRVMGRRNPGDTVPKAYRNMALYKLYQSAGFKEIGQTGWLYKNIASIFSKDGLNY